MAATAQLQPNTTQVPNFILDDLMAKLSDTALRVLLVVVRQTLGWEQDHRTKNRKTEDWISHAQLTKKTGRGRVAIASAIKELTETHKVVETTNKDGAVLSTAADRKHTQIHYRLNTAYSKSEHGGLSLASSHSAYAKSEHYKRNSNTTKEQKNGVPAVFDDLDLPKTDTPKRHRITQPWEDDAFRIADKLSISLSTTLKPRWLKLFKEAYMRKERQARIQQAYSYLYDLDTFRGLDAPGKLYYFMDVYNNYASKYRKGAN